MDSTRAQWLILNAYASMNPLLIDAMYFAAYGECDDKVAKRLLQCFQLTILHLRLYLTWDD